MPDEWREQRSEGGDFGMHIASRVLAGTDVRGIFGDPKARVIGLNRRSKNGMRLLRSHAGGLYDRKICRVRDLSCVRSIRLR
jgi:hypothetical protein